MLNSAQTNNALIALHRIILRTRFIAGTGTGKDDLTKVMRIMDHAEYLVTLMFEERDQTDCFWQYVRAIGKTFPEFAHLADDYGPQEIGKATAVTAGQI